VLELQGKNMKQLCINRTECPGDLPLENLSSEIPDAPDYVVVFGPPGDLPPPLGSWDSKYCRGVCTSHVSQADADLCAARNALLCVGHDPKDGGGGGGGGGWGRPDPNKIYPVPIPPFIPPGGYPSIPTFFNEPSSCTAHCPDGTPFDVDVAGGTIAGYTQGSANIRAHAYACDQAEKNKICFTIPPDNRACFFKDYKSTVNVKGQNSPYSFSVTVGDLPPGITIKNTGQTTAEISGTAKGVGFYEFEITAQDLIGNKASKTFEIGVQGLSDDTDTDFPDAEVGQPYSWQFTADGGKEPYVFRLGEGKTNINGIVLDQDGFWHGTPNKPGIINFTISVEDATKPRAYVCTQDLQVDIMAAKENFFGCENVQADLIFGGYPGQVPPLKFEPVQGTVPQGMELQQLDNQTAVLTGIPSPAGTYDFTLRVTDSQKNRVDQPCTFYVLGIINADQYQIPGGVVNTPYNYQLEALGGVEPDPTYLYQIISGTMPAGLTLHGDGLITGTPTTEQTSTLIIRVYDQANHFCQKSVTIIIYPTPPVNFANIHWTPSTSLNYHCQPYAYAITGTVVGGAFVEANTCPSGYNVAMQATAIMTGTLNYDGPANTPCRLSFNGSSFVLAPGELGVYGVTLKYKNGGTAYSSSTPGSFEFLWGATGGGITVEIRADAYSQHFGTPNFGSLGANASADCTLAPIG
jgi:hypothetical protein